MIRRPGGQPVMRAISHAGTSTLSNCDHCGRTLNGGGFQILGDALNAFDCHSDATAMRTCRHPVTDYGDVTICYGFNSPGKNAGIPGFALHRGLIGPGSAGERLPCRFSRPANRDVRRADLDRNRNAKLPLQGHRCLALWRIQEHRKRTFAFPVCAGRRHTQ